MSEHRCDDARFALIQHCEDCIVYIIVNENNPRLGTFDETADKLISIVYLAIEKYALFLYMAEKAGHNWFSALNLSELDLGKGIRNISATGRYDNNYQIIIPTELADYE